MNPPDSQVKSDRAERHWFCAACGTFDGPIAGEAFCDCCADGTVVERFFPASEVERLREALRRFARDDSEFVDEYEGGEPSDDVQLLLGITRSDAARYRELCGASDEQEPSA